MITHPAWIDVDLAALVHNAGVIRRAIPAGTRLGLLVKANAYGHGLEMGARAALAGGADQLIVAAFDEGLALRRAGIDAPILVVYPVAPSAVVDAVEAGLELSVGGLDWTRRTLEAWTARSSASDGATLRLHVEVDTGMARGGIPPDALAELIGLVDTTPATTLAGIWSHLADGSDPAVSAEQTHRFEVALASVAATGRPMPVRHLAATEGIFAATAPGYDMVRVGLGFYGELGLGVEPAPAMAALAAELRPAMTVRARPVRLDTIPAGASVGYGGEWTAARTSHIATLPIGYADGWTRAYWPGAEALVHGRRIPLVGRVSMDSVCADVTDVDGVTSDDAFVLLGTQGAERIAPNDLARLRRSIPNEVFCAFGPRLPRVYRDGDRVVAVASGADRVDRIVDWTPATDSSVENR
ncbi:MAG TPA: alanine racemase [Candidatus Limnocylindrales bacterium]|nr:alanine racemase [Candidatus Limnocylindrales bacterium]